MKRISYLAIGLLIIAALSVVADGQTFKVQKYSIGGEGGTDYLTAEAGTGRVFISRGSHVMVVDGMKGTVLGDITDAQGNHGIALSAKYNHGFITCRGDSTVLMFDLKTLATIKKVKIAVGGQDGIMYDDYNERVILTNHSKTGTVTAIDPDKGEIAWQTELADNAPEGAASDGKGKLFVNLERKNSIQVVDAKAMKSGDVWTLDSLDGPTGIAYDRATDRIFTGAGNWSAVVNGTTGKIVAKIKNGDGVDALGWDPSEKLIYIPAGRDSSVTVVHEDSPDKYTVVANVATARGAKTIAVDPVNHVAYLFQPTYGPPPADAKPDANGRPPRGSITGAYLYVITH
jgi:outer membrane protein assembly factor BamB